MDRITHPTAVDIGGGRRGFQSKDTLAGVPGTVVTAAHLNAEQEELMAVIEKAGLVPSPAVLTQLARAIRSQALNFRYTGGTANALTISLDPAPANWDDLLHVPLDLRITATNTLPNPTLTPNGLAPKTILRRDWSPVLESDLVIGSNHRVRWNGAGLLLESLGATEIPRLLQPDQYLYVRVDGNDGNDGLSNTAAGAFRQISRAVTVAQRRYAWTDRICRIRVGDGAYGPVVVTRAGATSVEIGGNLGSPANVLISGEATHGIVSTIGSTVTVSGVKVTSLGGAGMLAFDRSAIRFSSCEFGYCQQQHLFANVSSLISVDGDYTIASGSGAHMLAGAGSIIQVAGRLGTITAAANFATAFAQANGGTILANGAGWPGAGLATGPRYLSEVGGVVYTAGSGANFMPGSSAGSVATSGVYI